MISFLYHFIVSDIIFIINDNDVYHFFIINDIIYIISIINDSDFLSLMISFLSFLYH